MVLESVCHRQVRDWIRAVDVLKPSDTTETLQPTRVRLYLTELETESLDLLFIAVTSQRDLYTWQLENRQLSAANKPHHAMFTHYVVITKTKITRKVSFSFNKARAVIPFPISIIFNTTNFIRNTRNFSPEQFFMGCFL